VRPLAAVPWFEKRARAVLRPPRGRYPSRVAARNRGSAAGRWYRAAAVQGFYDLMLLLDPNAADERREEILSDVRGMIESGGAVVGEHDWGTRRMTFEIDHREEAAYHLIQFDGDAALLERLHHSLKIADGVLRFRTVGVKPGSPPPPTPRADTPRGREEAEGASSPSRAPRAAADRR